MIEFFAEDVDLPIELSEVSKKWIINIINSFDKKIGEIIFVFCSDKHILKVNNDFLKHDYYTDIITFDYCKKNIVSGDLVISTDTVRSNALKFNKEFKDELHRVVIHGILHLLGFKDATDSEKTEMRYQEDKALSILSTFH
ncbi:MAG: rRNA maturation RNase YbeY [Carboxylicivirga sp.]|jgi:rRNA maturation RNase YbeY|nr:rRNA maturation RNase YbeY [Carboxylicivirga sp.]